MQAARFEVSQGRMLIGMKVIRWNRGELVASVRYLSTRWKWSIGKVLRFLELLESEQMISKRQEFGQSIISLCNYSFYNEGKSATERKTEHLNDCNSEGNVDGRNSNENRSGTGAEQERNKTNKVNKEKEYVGINASTHTPDDLQMFSAFTEWIKKNAVNVSKMKEPFTIEQYLQLRKKITNRSTVQELLLKMHNWAPLLKKNNSAYLTILNWIRNDFNSGVNEKQTERKLVL
jgi:DNA-binding transcriptional MocR family regulator